MRTVFPADIKNITSLYEDRYASPTAKKPSPNSSQSWRNGRAGPAGHICKGAEGPLWQEVYSKVDVDTHCF